jgi:hypothetical protein
MMDTDRSVYSIASKLVDSSGRWSMVKDYMTDIKLEISSDSLSMAQMIMTVLGSDVYKYNIKPGVKMSEKMQPVSGRVVIS